jgi:MGT family glycosyltransferase
VGKAVDVDSFNNLPPNIRVEQFVPNSRMLAKAAIVVHHGGFGISQDTIFYGLPAVVIPVGQDLYENARRCTEAGVAVKLDFAELSSEKLRKAVQTVMESETIKRNTLALQQKFQSSNAGRTGANLLEQLAQTGRPVYRA